MLSHLPNARLVCFLLLWLTSASAMFAAEESRFAQTHSQSQYVHWIDLYDAEAQKIDPGDPNAAPYSPVFTCGKCHDYQLIAHGFHFNATDEAADSSQPGEPWVWTDSRTGTRLPLSYRSWPGTYRPQDLGINEWDFVLKFGRHMPGGGPGETGSDVSGGDDEQEKPKDAPRWNLSGQLGVDCLFCHSRDMTFSPEKRWDQVKKQNFAWASVAASGMATVEGSVSRLPDDFDPDEKPEASSDETLPKTTYASLRMNAEKQVFFDVIRTPSNNSCFYCHTNRLVGEGVTAEWNHDEDVHLRAGMSCIDCHRNGIGHHIVRGFEGEQNATDADVSTLSCRGCHMDDQHDAHGLPGGRLGAPKPLHRGLPALHLDRLSCTACHSGPKLGAQAARVQLARTHELGLPSHHLTDNTAPGIVEPVLMDNDGKLYPHRLMWPAFWGSIKGNKITPLNPEEAHAAIRRVFRVRRGKTFVETVSSARPSNEEKVAALGAERAKAPESELTEEEKAKLEKVAAKKALEDFREKLVDALQALNKAIDDDKAEPVYVGGGRAYRLADVPLSETEKTALLGEDRAKAPESDWSDEEKAKLSSAAAGNGIKEFSNAAAEPIAWHLAHNVRPARWSAGATGCYECHTLGAPLVESEVAAIGPAPVKSAVTKQMHEFAGFDKTKMDAWSLSFLGRTGFKYFGFFASGLVILVLLSAAMVGVNGLTHLIFRK